MKKWLHTLHRIEDTVLVLLLLAMIVLAGVDILARTLFGGGIVWVQPLLRVMVLWLGLLGALLATRSREHIAIDLINRLAGHHTRRWLAVLTSVFAAFICLLLAWHAQAFVRFAFEFGDMAFARVPAWPLQLVIPLSFTLMGVRFALQGFNGLFANPQEKHA